jgi:hypothetical protein
LSRAYKERDATPYYRWLHAAGEQAGTCRIEIQAPDRLLPGWAEEAAARNFPNTQKDRTMTISKFILCSSLFMGIGLAAPMNANAAGHVKLGTLSCQESSGWGFVFGSSRALKCTFSNGSHVEKFHGDVKKFGVDIGYQASGVLVWEVVSVSGKSNASALAGSYGGVTAEATAGVGLGANVLVGGTGGDIALQPLSIEGTTGVNIAAGIGEITLHP